MGIAIGPYPGRFRPLAGRLGGGNGEADQPIEPHGGPNEATAFSSRDAIAPTAIHGGNRDGAANVRRNGLPGAHDARRIRCYV